MGREVRLARASRETPRLLSEHLRREAASNQVAGADGVPFLLASQASIRWLLNNQVLRGGENPLDDSAIRLANYRPNIEIEGTRFGPFGEDSIDQLMIGDMSAYVVSACVRCPVPNIDQDTGQSSNVSSRLMRQRVGITDRGKKGVFMGQNLNHVYIPDQQVHVGAKVVVVHENDQPNVITTTINQEE